MKTICIVYLVLLGIPAAFSQNQRLDTKEAEELFSKRHYTAVWQYYKNLLAEDSVNTEFNFKMGVCYLNSRSQKEKAAGYLKKAAANIDQETSKEIINYKLFADASYLASNFDDALANYEICKQILLTKKNSNNTLSDEINRDIEMCKMAIELKELTTVLKDHKCNKKDIDSVFSKLKYSEETALPESHLVSKSVYSLHSNKKIRDDDLYEDKYHVSKNMLKQIPGNQDTTNTMMESTVGSSVDGQIMLLYRDENGDGNLYTSELRGNEWTAPEKINKIINNKSWETNEFISADGNTLYFVSNRAGGFGGKDIYKCRKQTNGEWGKGINMGPKINSSFDEEAPFIYPDEKTIFFSSNRYRPKGGFDNFMCFLTDSTGWSLSINAGYPVRKTDMNPDNIGEQAGNTTATTKENYRVTFIDQKKTPITIIKGKVIGSDEKIPSYIEITLANNETGEIAGIYHPDSKTGKYACIVPNGKNISMTYEAEGYFFHSVNINRSKDSGFYKLQQPIKLVPIAPESKIILNNIFFEDTSSVLSSTSRIELNNIYNYLNHNQKSKIELSFSIDKKSSSIYAKHTEQKLQSVLIFLVEKGIDGRRIECKVYKNLKKSKMKSGEIAENEPEKLELKILSLK